MRFPDKWSERPPLTNELSDGELCEFLDVASRAWSDFSTFEIEFCGSVKRQVRWGNSLSTKQTEILDGRERGRGLLRKLWDRDPDLWKNLDEEDDMATRKKNAHIFDRDPHDWYVEESRASEALFATEEFSGPIWDCACGGGNIVVSALLYGLNAAGSDIVRRTQADWFTGEKDFLTTTLPTIHNIVTNPPFFRGAGTEAFARKALEVTSGKVAIFAPMKFISGDARAAGLFAQHPPRLIRPITPRVSCPPGEYLLDGKKPGGGTEDFCWIIWPKRSDRDAGGYTTELKWLRTKEVV